MISNETARLIEAAMLFKCADCTDAGNYENNCRPINEVFLVGGRVICEDCLDCGYPKDEPSERVSAPRIARTPADGPEPVACDTVFAWAWTLFKNGEMVERRLTWTKDDPFLITVGKGDGRSVTIPTSLFAHPVPVDGPAADVYGYATRLLVSLMEKHCPDRSPQWEPLPDLMGVLTQLDNLSTCLVRAPIQEHEFRADGVGVTGSDLCIDCGKERYEHDNRPTSIERDVPADGWVWRIAGFKDGWFTDDAEKAERMRLDGVFVSAVSILSAPHSQPDELKRRT